MRFDAGQLQAYRRDGYVVVDGPFPRALTAACLEAVERAAIDPAANTGDSKGNHFRLKPQVEGSYWCDLDHSLPFLRIELHPEIVELARQLAGDDDIYFRNGGINELAPDRSFLWHRDSEDDYVEFMHYFSGADPSSGCLRVIAGSHAGPAEPLVAEVARRRRERGDPERPSPVGYADVELPDEISLPLHAGQLLVRSSRIFHATWRNGSTAGRLMHHWLFRESNSDDHRFRFEDYLTPELIEALTPEQRRVLWLERPFELDAKWQSEGDRERGRVRWGVR